MDETLRSIGVDAALRLKRDQYECTRTYSFAVRKMFETACWVRNQNYARRQTFALMRSRVDINIIEAYRNSYAIIPCWNRLEAFSPTSCVP